jgi:hypothetical protein
LDAALDFFLVVAELRAFLPAFTDTLERALVVAEFDAFFVFADAPDRFFSVFFGARRFVSIFFGARCCFAPVFFGARCFVPARGAGRGLISSRDGLTPL